MKDSPKMYPYKLVAKGSDEVVGYSYLEDDKGNIWGSAKPDTTVEVDVSSTHSSSISELPSSFTFEFNNDQK